MKDCKNCKHYRFGYDRSGKETNMCMHPDQFLVTGPVGARQVHWLGSDIKHTYNISNPCGPDGKLFESLLILEPLLIHGRRAVQLNKLTSCDDVYYIDENLKVWEYTNLDFKGVNAYTNGGYIQVDVLYKNSTVKRSFRLVDIEHLVRDYFKNQSKKEEPKVVFFQDTKNNHAELFGKPAVRLNELINVHERYWIDQDGTVWEPSQGDWQKVQAASWAGDSRSCFKLEEAGTSYLRYYSTDNLFVAVKEYFRVKEREKNSIEKAASVVQSKPKKQWVIGYFQDNETKIKTFDEVYTDEAEVNRVMEEKSAILRNDTFVKLEVTGTLKTQISHIWSKA